MVKNNYMEILAISGSVRAASYNTALRNAISKLAPAHINVELFGFITIIPIFQPEMDEQNIPDSVENHISRIRKSDGIIIGSPEYAHAIPGILKNALDLLVATDTLVLKPVAVTTVSTSGLGGVRSYASLVQILSAMNSTVVINGSLCVPDAKIKFDAALNLTDEITIKALEVTVMALARAIQHQNRT